jgi:LysM domain
MARLVGYLIPIPPVRGRALVGKRALAVATIAVLLVGTVAPSWAAAAAEVDTEGEGTALPGLENPHFDPGGEEAALEVLPGSSAPAVEASEGAPIETEPAQEPELPEPAPAAEEAVPPVVVPEAGPPPAEAPAPVPPEYTPAAPEYTPPAPSSAAVENEPIVAPPSASEPPPRAEAPPQPEPEATAPEAVAEAPPVVVPGSESEAPAQEAPPQAPTAVPGSGGVSPPLRDRSSYTVRRGDCLWSIAEALLPSGAGNEEIAAEVARLWHLNADRIGTGDPNVILAGTQLALG